MNTRTRRTTTVIDRRRAAALLYPIAAFFNRGGMSRAQSLAALTTAIEDVRRAEGKRKLEHIGAGTCYLDVIAAWTRQRKFLDPRGRPRSLPISGANGFGVLFGSAASGRNPEEVLRVLIRFRNVRRLSTGHVQLVSPLFRASAGPRMAFEPIACFLNDASSTLTHTLKKTGASAGPDLFWRTVESVQISRPNAKRFVEFAKQRSLLFLFEMDDWLQAHADVKSHSSKKKIRVGLGLFSIYSQ
jgi:hypothetical protein